MKLLVIASAVAVTSIVSVASADERLGDRGTIALSGSVNAQLGKNDGGAKATLLEFSPSIAWFPANDVSLSISPTYTRQTMAENTDGSTKVRSYGVDAAVGVLLHAGDRVDFWPRIGAHLAHLDTEGAVSPDQADIYGVTAEMPILFHVTPHTFASVSFGSIGYAKFRSDLYSSWQLVARWGPMPTFGFGGWF